MNTTAEKLALLLNTKTAIKAVLIEKGQEVDDIFSSYPDRIRAIQTDIISSNDGEGNVTFAMGTNTLVYNALSMIDSSTGRTFNVYVTDGKLIMEDSVSVNDVTHDVIILADKLTGTRHYLRVTDADLTMEDDTNSDDVPSYNIVLTDRSTNAKYNFYIMDGKLTIEEREE